MKDPVAYESYEGIFLQHCAIEFSVTELPISALSNKAATSHTWLLST